MMISTRGRYALRVLVDLAEHAGPGNITLREVAECQDISEKYLESIVKELVRAGILTAERGKGGGYRLGKEPEDIGVYEVLVLMEGTLAPVFCLEEGGKTCPRMADCRTLPLWQGLEQTIRSYLSGFTIRDLMNNRPDGLDFVI